jgi:hypothetical protein
MHLPVDQMRRQTMAAAMTEATDLFDRMANPHPRMWGEAELAYRVRHDSLPTLAYWEGYLSAMCAATGYERTYFLDRLAAQEAAGTLPQMNYYGPDWAATAVEVQPGQRRKRLS